MKRYLACGVIFYLVLFPLGQALRVPILLDRGVLVADLVVLVLVLTWFAVGWRRGVGRPVFVLLVVFWLVGGLSLIFSPVRSLAQDNLVGWFYLIRWGAYAGLFLLVYDLTSEISGFSRAVLCGLAWAGGVAAVWGAWQYLVFPDIRPLVIAGWDEHLNRAVGSFLDPAFLGLILGLFLFLVLGKVFSMNNILSVWEERGVGVFAGAVLALTYSRASFLAFLVGGLSLSVVKRNFKLAVLVIVTVMGTIWLLPRSEGEGVRLERTTSAVARIVNWEQGLAVAKKYPVLGVGFGKYLPAAVSLGIVEEGQAVGSHATGNDASLINVLATTGILGILVYLYLGWKLVKMGRSVSNSKTGRVWGEVMLVSLAGVVVHSFFANSLFYPFVMGWLAIVWGVGLGSVRNG